jgi:hypothetical protein
LIWDGGWEIDQRAVLRGGREPVVEEPARAMEELITE